MYKAACLSAVATVLLLAGGPVRAADIAGAGSGSNGGTVTGTTNENSSMMKTGTAGGQQPVPADGTPLPANALPDNAIMNAGGEAKPGTTGSSQPSNLNGKSP